MNQSLTTTEIIEIVAKIYEVTTDELVSKSRKQPLPEARYFVYKALKEKGKSLKIIGKAIGDRDHTTVLHGLNKLNDLLRFSESVQYADKVVGELLK